MDNRGRELPLIEEKKTDDIRQHKSPEEDRKANSRKTLINKQQKGQNQSKKENA